MTGNATIAPLGSVLPEVNRLPDTEQKSALVNTQRHRLSCKRCSDVSRHVIRPFIIVLIRVALSPAISRPKTILRNNRLHPRRQITQHTWIGIFIDGQACTGVQTSQMQHALLQAALCNPGIQALVQAEEARPLGCQLQNMQMLNQLHDPERTCLHR